MLLSAGTDNPKRMLAKRGVKLTTEHNRHRRKTHLGSFQMTFGLVVVLGHTNKFARVSSCKNLGMPAALLLMRKIQVWETTPMFIKWISKTFRKHHDSKHCSFKSSYMIEKVPQQTSKSTYAIHCTNKKATVGNIPKGIWLRLCLRWRSSDIWISSHHSMISKDDVNIQWWNFTCSLKNIFLKQFPYTEFTKN